MIHSVPTQALADDTMPNHDEPPTHPPIENATDLVTAALASKAIFNTRDVWFSGQADASWSLVPSVHRGHDYTYERNILTRFVRQAPSRYARCPLKDDTAGWLFLAQHYRLPTRLLDWSASILTAAYFAVCELDETPGAVWVMKPTALNKFQAQEEGIYPPAYPAAAPMFLRPFKAKQEEIDRVLAVIPPETDVRMLVQQAYCTIHGTVQPIESLPEADNFVAKFEIPAQAKSVISAGLVALGITESFLFPDLEHLASDLKAMSFIEPTA